MTTRTPKVNKFPVRAKRRGYYDYLRQEGEVFYIRDKADFSPKWMKKMHSSTPVTHNYAEYTADVRLTHKRPPDLATLNEYNEHLSPIEKQADWD